MHEILIIGAGSIGERHIRCFLATGRVRVVFVEPRSELREQVAGRYAGVVGFDSLPAALQQHQDAAVIATPAPLHVPQAMQLIDRSVHVLIEKPLSVTLDGVNELAAVARERSVVCGVAYVHRAHSALDEMRNAMVSGEFGKPLQLVAVTGQSFPFYRPAYAQTYYAKHESGGGAVQDALTHLINAGEWLAGPIDRVVADAGHLAVPGVTVEDTVHVIARQGDVLASYSLNQHQAPNELTITVICERGTVRYELHQNRWRSMIKPGDGWTDHVAAAIERDTLFSRQASTFLDAIEGRGPLLCSLAEGIQTLRVNIAILSSIASGQWVSTQRA
jgi:predicted dehydrogenase